MAKKNKNKRRGPQPLTTPPVPPMKRNQKPHGTHGQPMRETIESLVIAFVLAFLFRTFQAEAFVIPTGSMAPTLMGRHEDVHCEQCGLRFKLSDSEMRPEQVKDAYESSGRRLSPQEIIRDNATHAGQCPNCRHSMFVKPVPGAAAVNKQKEFSGDRILVNKYLYSFTDPKRWDVVVFKYPGNAVENYIKRLVGLPGEILRVEHGDLYRRSEDGSFEVLRKPPGKVLAMRQLVHDTDYDPSSLYNAGYPLRWSGDTQDSPWKIAVENTDGIAEQTFSLDPTDKTAWLRYTHRPPSFEHWRDFGRTTASGRQKRLESQPHLITDYNAYNTSITYKDLEIRQMPSLFNAQKGLHWVGDLIIEAEVAIESDAGALTLELVESGQKFLCEIDVATGQATLSTRAFEAESPDGRFGATAATKLRGNGKHSVRFANVDDQLSLWIDGRLIKFDEPTIYDPTSLIAKREDLIPRSSPQDAGDLSPVAIGGKNLKLVVNRLGVYRDIYYIADDGSLPKRVNLISEFPLAFQSVAQPRGFGSIGQYHDVRGVELSSGNGDVVEYED